MADMSEHASSEIERLLGQALRPVEPPESLSTRLEATLTSLTEMAAEELESWELAAMRDPRNWVRPAAALVVGGAAATALILVRAQRRSKKSGRPLEALEAGARDVTREIRKRLGR